MDDRARERSFDALVVGGGVIGLACAWRAAQRGLRVCLLERDRPGAGASGVAAGMLAPVGEAQWGEEELIALNLGSHRLWPSFAEELAEASGTEFSYRRDGSLHVALDRDEAEELHRRRRLHEEAGVVDRWLRPGECRRLEPGLAPGIAGGVQLDDEASVDPATLCEALSIALRAAGGTIEAGAEVVAAEFGSTGAELRTADGRRFAAASVLLAAGCWAGSADWVPEACRPPVRPVKGEILTLAGPPDEPLCRTMVVTERVYVVPRPDGRVIVGATVEERGFDLTVTAGGTLELLRESYRALPDVGELELVGARAGLRPATPDNRPIIGRSAEERLLVATGHYRNGVLLAPATAEAIAALLGGESPPTDVEAFSPRRFEAPREAVAR